MARYNLICESFILKIEIIKYTIFLVLYSNAEKIAHKCKFLPVAGLTRSEWVLCHWLNPVRCFLTS